MIDSNNIQSPIYAFEIQREPRRRWQVAHDNIQKFTDERLRLKGLGGAISSSAFSAGETEDLVRFIVQHHLNINWYTEKLKKKSVTIVCSLS